MSDSTQHITPEAVPSYVREERLRQIRREAEQVEKATGVREKLQRTAVPRASVETGYYGVPLLKPAPWSPDIPLYFFTGGAAGAAAIIGSVASFTGADPRLARDARYIAAIGGAISPALLIHDLGMPSRFLNMLRVFKVQSPMSVGSWTLFAFSGSSAAAAFLCAARERIRLRTSLRIIEKASQFLSLLTGAVLSTYTGVLISATAIPVWNQNTGILPVHFATSGLSAAGALLELCGHTAPALNTIGIASALGETAIGASLELRKHPALQPLKSGRSGMLSRLGEILSGPLPLVFRLLSIFDSNRKRKTGLRKVAAASAVTGSLLTRFAWTQAGSVSAKNPRIPLQLPEKRS